MPTLTEIAEAIAEARTGDKKQARHFMAAATAVLALFNRKPLAEQEHA